MNIKMQIIARAEQVFDRHGFTGSGMDRLTAAANVSSRTLYKHVGSKAALMGGALESRRRRTFDHLNSDSVQSLFDALESWTMQEGARGCLFLRALADTGGAVPEVTEAVAGYRRELTGCVARAVANDLGRPGQGELVDQVLVLFEGAVTAASYRGIEAVSAARRAAETLVQQAS